MRYVDQRDESLEASLRQHAVVTIADLESLHVEKHKNLPAAICAAPEKIDETRWTLWQIRACGFIRMFSVSVARQWIYARRYSDERLQTFRDDLVFPISEHEDAVSVVAMRPPGTVGGLNMGKYRELFGKPIIPIAATPKEFAAIKRTYDQL